MNQASPRFAPEAVEAMNRAYNSAQDYLQKEGAGLHARVKAGERIMVLGRNGITDERKLRFEAIQEALGRPPRDFDSF